MPDPEKSEKQAENLRKQAILLSAEATLWREIIGEHCTYEELLRSLRPSVIKTPDALDSYIQICIHTFPWLKGKLGAAKGIITDQQVMNFSAYLLANSQTGRSIPRTASYDENMLNCFFLNITAKLAINAETGTFNGDALELLTLPEQNSPCIGIILGELETRGLVKNQGIPDANQASYILTPEGLEFRGFHIA